MTERSNSMQHDAIEAAIRIGLIAIIALYCLAIIRPFLTLMMWGGLLAVAFYPLLKKVTAVLNGREKTAASLFTVTLLGLLFLPAIILGVGSIDEVTSLYEHIQAGTLDIPPPNSSVAEWPVIGEKVYAFWNAASHNLESVVLKYKSEIGVFVGWLAGSVGTAVGALIKFAFSVVIAGVCLAKADFCAVGLHRIASRFLGERGDYYLNLATGTIRSVANGVVGVALIQASASFIAFLIAGVPFASLWVLVILLLAIVQLPTLIVLGPAILWVWSEASTGMAVFFTVWSVIVGLSDNVLKPLLLGRGVDVPMLVVLLGAIGGMILSGIIGLFVGSVVLALGYTLLMEWIDEVDQSTTDSAN